MDLTRRSITRGAAWSVPVLAVAAQAPAFAASAPVVIPNSEVLVTKCPGQSDKSDPWSYIATFLTDSPVSNVSVSSFTVNGVAFEIERIVPEGNSFHVVTRPSTNSADAAGTGTILYNTGGSNQTFSFAYNGSHPNQQLCRRI